MEGREGSRARDLFNKINEDVTCTCTRYTPTMDVLFMDCKHVLINNLFVFSGDQFELTLSCSGEILHKIKMVLCS